MALAAVSSAINNTLVPFLAGEAKLLQNVHAEVASIKAELESMMGFLRDADSVAESGDEVAEHWVKQVRAVAYQIDDIIGEYILHQAAKPQRHGFVGFLRKVAYSIHKLKAQHDIASQSRDIREKISDIRERAYRNGFSSLEQGSSSKTEYNTWDDPRIASPFIEDDEVVGIESTRKELIQRMINGESNRMVISIVGMGGCGKTTLAKKVFEKVSEWCDCHAWVSVSQSFKTEDLLRRMIKQFSQSIRDSTPAGIDWMDQNSLIHLLREYLCEKRYLIAFDDVWTFGLRRFLKLALPKNSTGSRIILTTRSEDVAAFCMESSSDHMCKLQPLPEEAAWELFCMKAFQHDRWGVCPPELREVSHAILRKCEGLPLAIVTIGALLSTKIKVVAEWKKLFHCLGAELEWNPRLTMITKILLLSYHDLPYHLKLCFVYFGSIPEDYLMRRGRLIRLWIAEDFIKGQKGKSLEEVAEEYLTELVHRSLVQVLQRKFDGRIESCKVHYLLREIILAKSEELGFNRVLSIPRHLTLDEVLESISTAETRLRSVIFFSGGGLPEQSLGTLAVKFKLLKVLDLQDAHLYELHEEVGNLAHLRYLSVKGTKVKIIPKSIGNLSYLQTLNLKYSHVSELQIEIISRLHKLRHLIADSLRIQGGIGHLVELQTLWGVVANYYNMGEWVSLIDIKELENLKQLRKLGICDVKRENGRALCAAVEKMIHLSALRVWATSENEFLDLHYLSSPPESLQHLRLAGRLEMFRDWITKCQNLVHLTVKGSGLTYSDAIQALQALPCLMTLVIQEEYNAEQLCFEVGGFHQLKKLHLQGLKRLNSIRIEEGALPLLNELCIGSSPQLKEVPSGIRHLRQFKTLSFSDMPAEFLDRIQPGEGQDYWIVEHIPTVQLYVEFVDYTRSHFQAATNFQIIFDAVRRGRS